MCLNLVFLVEHDKNDKMCNTYIRVPKKRNKMRSPRTVRIIVGNVIGCR